MASKKRKVDFSADAILSEISQAREFAQNVQQFRKSLSLVRIKEMLRTVQTVDFDVAGLLALLLGFDVTTSQKRSTVTRSPAVALFTKSSISFALKEGSHLRLWKRWSPSWRNLVPTGPYL